VERLTPALRGLGIGIGWLALAAVLSFGSAGLVAGLDRLPGTSARPELTWSGDVAANAALEVATTRLEAIQHDIQSLGEFGRLALADMAGRDFSGMEAAVAQGSQGLASFDANLTAFRSALDAVPGIGPGEEMVISRPVRKRYDALVGGASAVSQLDGSWNAFGTGAVTANQLATLLGEHDRIAGGAAQAGASQKYDAAIKQLAEASDLLVKAGRMRDQLKNTTDVSTLTAWIDRNTAYDRSLRHLYQALVKSRGKVTTEVRAAFTAEEQARKGLPGDTRGLVVIMANVAQGGLNQALIAIETARGHVSSALSDARAAISPSASPGATPAP